MMPTSTCAMCQSWIPFKSKQPRRSHEVRDSLRKSLNQVVAHQCGHCVVCQDWR